MKTRPSIDRMEELFTWDVEAGLLYWKVGRGRASAGSLAGRVNGRGYREVCIDSTFVPVHQAIYFLATGEWVDLIDHINGERADNRFVNLRAATKADNARNRTNWVHRKLLGAHRIKGGWCSLITSDGVVYRLGTFESEELAHAAYCEARNRVAIAERNARVTCLEEMQARRIA